MRSLIKYITEAEETLEDKSNIWCDTLREELDNIHNLLDEYQDSELFTMEEEELSQELLAQKEMFEYMLDKMNEIENQLQDINKIHKTDICNIK